jgi:hypothetical protein|tara:strand:+ start:19671 stop:19916 length:246 start_codon:yes stop_codon:yes gene_type:complete
MKLFVEARLSTSKVEDLIVAAKLVEEKSGFDFLHVKKNDRGLEEAVVKGLLYDNVERIVEILNEGEEEGVLDFEFNLSTHS